MNCYELPKEFLDRIKTYLESEEEFNNFKESYESKLYQGLRLNTLKSTDNEEFVNAFPEYKLEPIDWVPTGFYYDGEARPGKSVYHEAGLYYMQEPSAMSVAEAAEVIPGMRVLDLCSAPGGKATGLAAALQGKGILVANEIHPARAKILSQNIERMGIANAIVTNASPDELEDRFSEYFDCIVVDAPCSGEGMFRKEPEAIPNWSVDNVAMCADRQKDILTSAMKMLADGGRLVYSTCTFAREEDEDNVEWLLESYPELKLVKTNRFWPHKVKGEGHFLAVFDKGERVTDFEDLDYSDVRVYTRSEKLLAKDRTRQKIFNKFACEFFTEEGLSKYAEGHLSMFGDNLYLMPAGFNISLDGIKCLRYGLNLGSFLSDRFEPSHSLAMAVKPTEVKIYVEISEEDATRYLHGEALNTDTADKGWCVVGIKKYPLGLGKVSGNSVKNHYPKGLRTKY